MKKLVWSEAVVDGGGRRTVGPTREAREAMTRDDQQRDGNQGGPELVPHDGQVPAIARNQLFCLRAGSGNDALQFAYEEALDLAMYLRQEIERRNGEP